MADEIKRKPGRPKGTFKEDPRKKGSITLPQFWWSWLNLQPHSQSQTVQRALESWKLKIESGENDETT